MQLIILDRDGVINEDSDDFIKSPDEFIVYPGVIDSLVRLSQSGYTIAIATNQSGIARGLFTLQTLNAIHQKLIDLVQAKGGKIDGIFYCPHIDQDNCSCRKPKTGLFEQIAQYFNISLKGVPSVGDSLRDLQAASKMQCQPIHVLTGKGKKTREQGNLPEGTLLFNNLNEVCDFLLTSKRN